MNSFGCVGRHLPDKAIDLVDEACANVRVQLDSQPEEIDNLERKRMQLEVELHALEKEKDKASKARLVDVSVDYLTMLIGCPCIFGLCLCYNCCNHTFMFRCGKSLTT